MPRPKQRYPYLSETAEQTFDLEIRDEKRGGMTVLPHTQGRVEISFYKGSVILCVQDGNFPAMRAVAWLCGDALDALNADLAMRTRQWKDAYRRARSIMLKNLRKKKMTADTRGFTLGGRRARRERGLDPRPSRKRKKSS